MTDNEISYADFTVKKFSMDIKMPFVKNDGSAVLLPMVILTGRELREAKKAAEKITMAVYDGKLPKKDEASSYDELFAENMCWQLVFYSVRMPNDLKKKFFPTFDAMEDMLTPDQAGILKNDYITLQMNQPWLLNLDSEEKINAMISQLMEDGSSFFILNSLNTVSQNLLVVSLISQLKSFMTDSTGLIEPPSDTSI